MSPILGNLDKSYSPIQLTRLNDDVMFLIENIGEFDDNDPIDHTQVDEESEPEVPLVRKRKQRTGNTTAIPTVTERPRREIKKSAATKTPYITSPKKTKKTGGEQEDNPPKKPTKGEPSSQTDQPSNPDHTSQPDHSSQPSFSLGI